MKLVWSPETASRAYIDTVKSCVPFYESGVAELVYESGVAELMSAMAAGWNAQLIVETWSGGGPTAASVGLAVACQHTRGRHVCIVPDEESRTEYAAALGNAGMSAEVVIGDPEEAIAALPGIDFLVVDCRRTGFSRSLGRANVGRRGAVLVCKNASAAAAAATDFRWRGVLGGGARLVRSVFLPVGKGLDIAHVGSGPGGDGGGYGSGKNGGRRRWVKHVDKVSGEVHVIRV